MVAINSIIGSRGKTSS